MVGNTDLMLLGRDALFQFGEVGNRLRQNPVGVQCRCVQTNFVQKIARLSEGCAALHKRPDKTGLIAPYKNSAGRIQQSDGLKPGLVEFLSLWRWLKSVQFRPEANKHFANRLAEVGLELREFCRVELFLDMLKGLQEAEYISLLTRNDGLVVILYRLCCYWQRHEYDTGADEQAGEEGGQPRVKHLQFRGPAV